MNCHSAEHLKSSVLYSRCFSGGQVANVVLACQIIVALHYAQRSSMDWVLRQFSRGMILPPSLAMETTILRLSVSSVAPVFPLHTSIVGVLEFNSLKASRRSIYSVQRKAPPDWRSSPRLPDTGLDSPKRFVPNTAPRFNRV